MKLCFRLSLLLLLSVSSVTGQTFNEFPVPWDGTPLPVGITAGPDGNLWFTSRQLGTNHPNPFIGRITPEGVITTFDIPSGLSGTGPAEIATGPDGNLWFTESFDQANNIVRITTAGSITKFPIPTPGSGATGIATGPDGALWFTERNGNNIGRITTSGAITEFPIPTPSSGSAGITTGPDGALWFTEQFGDKIGRITTSGAITEFPISPGSQPQSIVAGLDGNLYFAEAAGNKIGRITTSGVITEFPIPTPDALPQGVALGSDGAIWFTEYRAGKIGRLSIPVGPQTCEADATTLCLNGSRFRVTADWRKLDGSTGHGQAVSLTPDSGYFWFFNQANIEAVVKVLNACSGSDRYWVFAAGLTNVEVTLRVVDTHTGSTKSYVNLLGTAFEPIQDTSAFETCP